MIARASLPAHLAERTHVVRGGSRTAPGAFVLYWMHHAVRAHENPALDVALRAAVSDRLPLVVCQGLGGRRAHNSDRHHTFILQGAREVQRELAERGITYAFHLVRRADVPGPLRSHRRAA
ncbi:MAG: deoxyribodipyrimidine photo-lyase [Gammaproteobacteria bacterium]|nr:deoxyribodipyrimidine photo-lyase [Gammaproteobacteria bacterium]NIR83236.1 deoxyribodipyrimidine photo-lyase [Gammaproteobacteria bacterium]NIR91040.1 deoxyribodipyrimidine photo-lyase [Gammaproteobacteria bacterium]NIU04401.1 deoxyribodipyrimidine photo-lyase [Gammaproteobacteria bacterium]NIV76356.1 hypothetical protein [Gammaproteobacteria bacterium]